MRMQGLKERLFAEIEAALDTTETEAPTSQPRASRKGHWRRVWESAKHIFSPAGPSSGAGGPAKLNDVELQLSLAQLHLGIADSMAAEVGLPALVIACRWGRQA